MANFDAINDSIRAIDWPSTPTQDLNSACAKFTSIFLHVINSHVPSKTVCDQPRPPWLPRPLLHKIKHRWVLFHRAITSKSPLLLSDYRSLRNAISAEVKRSKSQFFNSISHSPQRFWSYVRSLRRNKDSVPPLTSTSGSLISDNAGLKVSSVSLLLILFPLLLPHWTLLRFAVKIYSALLLLFLV